MADLIYQESAIGARTTESQMPRVIERSVDASRLQKWYPWWVQIACDAVMYKNPHHFLSVTKQGLSAIVSTRGNEDCHDFLLLRGGGGSFDAIKHVQEAVDLAEKAQVNSRVMIGCSHGNSNKDHTRQPIVAA